MKREYKNNEGVDQPMENPDQRASFRTLTEAFENLDSDEVEKTIQKLLSQGEEPFAVLDNCRVAMTKVGQLFSEGIFHLAELMLSADIFQDVVGILEPLLVADGKAEVLGRVVIGTPKGDIHDIGKNIVATVLRANGFEVFDVGVDVEPDVFVEKVLETDAQIVAMSALITPAFEPMKAIVDLLVEKGQRSEKFIIIGGGCTTNVVRESIGADAWTLDPQESADILKKFMGVN